MTIIIITVVLAVIVRGWWVLPAGVLAYLFLHTAKRCGIIALLAFAFTVQGQQYNAYGLHLLTDAQVEAVAGAAPLTDIRFGGEEYTAHGGVDADKAVKFARLSGATIHLVAPEAYDRFHEVYGALRPYVSSEVTYGNEPWLDVKYGPFNDLFNYIFNRRRYTQNEANHYYKQGQAYAREGQAFKAYMRSKGHDIRLILNVPLPQSEALRGFLKGCAGAADKASIHIYGKPNEGDYLSKLSMWVNEVKAYGWEVMVGEFNGIFLHEHRELKGTAKHRQMEADILRLLSGKGIREVYHFTYVANAHMMRWSNPPIYHRWIVSDENVVTE